MPHLADDITLKEKTFELNSGSGKFTFSRLDDFSSECDSWKEKAVRKREPMVVHEFRFPNYSDWVVWEGDPKVIESSKYSDIEVIRSVQTEYFIPFGRKKIVMPKELSFFEEVIEESNYILELEDGWDDEDAKKYELKTWESAIGFVLKYSKWIFDTFNIVVKRPKIYHADNGSIDILWKTDNSRLLINIPESNDVASFYGDNYKDDKVKGTFDINNFNQGLLLTISSI